MMNTLENIRNTVITARQNAVANNIPNMRAPQPVQTTVHGLGFRPFTPPKVINKGMEQMPRIINNLPKNMERMPRIIDDTPHIARKI